MPFSGRRKRHVLITSDKAKPARRQHTKPCSDCPWRRDAVPGWLGNQTPEEWQARIHGESELRCHTVSNQQCAGAAIMRANVCKLTRNRAALRLAADPVVVFTTTQEFVAYHKAARKPRKR